MIGTAPIIELIREVSIAMEAPKCDHVMKHEVFEDKYGAIELVKAPKTNPKTNHIAIKFQYFYFFVKRGFASID